MEDIVHDCSYFENDAESYWEPVKLFEGRSDMRPMTKAENEPGGSILDRWRGRVLTPGDRLAPSYSSRCGI